MSWWGFLLWNEIGHAIWVVSLDKFHLLIIVPKKKKKSWHSFEEKCYYTQIFHILTLQKFYFYNRAENFWKNFEKKLMIY